MRPATYLLAGFAVVMWGITVGLGYARPATRGDGSPHPVKVTLDLSTADAASLSLLPGIGPSKARRIVERRSRAGPFTRVEDLIDVPGIGERTLAAVRPYLRCGTQRSGAEEGEGRDSDLLPDPDLLEMDENP